MQKLCKKNEDTKLILEGLNSLANKIDLCNTEIKFLKKFIKDDREKSKELDQQKNKSKISDIILKQWRIVSALLGLTALIGGLIERIIKL